jgi:apolipoprotein D and lipocalin family protein
MKNKYFIALSALVLTFISASARAEIQTVPYVDVNKYLGDWYQIAHVPLWFEGISDCACARQRLTATSNAGIIGVLNTCTKDDGSTYSISGTASDDNASTNSKFTVSFEGVPFKGSYWIVGLDTQYRYAVVTDQGGDALYILSKTPTLSKNLYDEAVRIAAQQLDTSKLVVTKQKACTYPK